MEKVGVGALVVLTSIINAAPQNRSRIPLIKGNSPANEDVRQMLIDSGFFDQVSPSFPVSRSQDTKGGMFKRQGKKTAPAVAYELSKMGEEITSRMITRKGLYAVMIEAMGNTKEHARPEKPSSESWWLMGYCNFNSGSGEFAFYDAGVGIAASLRNRFMDKLKKFIGLGQSDVELLRIALEEGHSSRTRLAYRGHGLPKMAKTVERQQLVDIRIHTNRAFASMGTPRYEELPEEFPGTLIRWSIKK